MVSDRLITVSAVLTGQSGSKCQIKNNNRGRAVVLAGGSIVDRELHVPYPKGSFLHVCSSHPEFTCDHITVWEMSSLLQGSKRTIALW